MWQVQQGLCPQKLPLQARGVILHAEFQILRGCGVRSHCSLSLLINMFLLSLFEIVFIFLQTCIKLIIVSMYDLTNLALSPHNHFAVSSAKFYNDYH